MSKRARELALQGKQNFLTKDHKAPKQRKTENAAFVPAPESPCPSGVDEEMCDSFFSELHSRERTRTWVRSTLNKAPTTNLHLKRRSEQVDGVQEVRQKRNASNGQSIKLTDASPTPSFDVPSNVKDCEINNNLSKKSTTSPTGHTSPVVATGEQSSHQEPCGKDLSTSGRKKQSSKDVDSVSKKNAKSPTGHTSPVVATGEQSSHQEPRGEDLSTSEISSQSPIDIGRLLNKNAPTGHIRPVISTDEQSSPHQEPHRNDLPSSDMNLQSSLDINSSLKINASLPTGHVTPVISTDGQKTVCQEPHRKEAHMSERNVLSAKDTHNTKSLPVTSTTVSARRRLEYDASIPEEVRGDEELTTALLSFNQILQENIYELDEEGNISATQPNGEDILLVESVEVPQTPSVSEEVPPAVPINPTVQQERPKSRKRMRNPEIWKKNVSKRLFNSGQEHLNLKGNLVAAREMGAGCHEGCRYKCHSKISLEERKQIFKEYWKLGDKTAQWNFVNCMTVVSKPAQRKDPKSKARENSRKYYFKCEGKMQQVCQKMFLSTLAISESVCKTATERMKARHTLTPDKRGKKKKNVCDLIGGTVNANIHTHISKFPAVPSHLCRARTQRKYLEEGLSVRKMYKMYCEWMKQKHLGETVATERQYRDYFCENFNYGFYQPKKDQCDLCCVYSNCNEKQRKNLQKNYEDHLKLKEEARTQKQEDKKNSVNSPDTTFVCFDLQKVLATPKTKTGSLYYKRKWSVYNFTMYDGTHSKGYCYVWHEGEAKRGANEIGSCVFEFVKMMVEKYETKIFIFWSDNCAGQNKNKYVFALYTLICAQFNVEIIHRFLEKGHTQNEADSVHARIEKFARPEDVYTPSQWYDIIEKAKADGSPYEVIRMNGKFKDYHTLAQDHQQWSNHKNAKWKSVREVSCKPENPNVLKLRHRIAAGSPFIEINVKKRTKGHPINLKTYKAPMAYIGPCKLKAAKLKDLATLCNDLTVPSKYHHEYRTLRGIELNRTNESSDEDNISDENDSGEEQVSTLEDDDSDEEPNYERAIDTPETSTVGEK